MSDSDTSTNAASPAASRRGVIDQFEGDLAAIVFDDNEQLVVARSALPPDARAGDVVIVSAPPMAGTSAQALSAAPTIKVDAASPAASRRGVIDQFEGDLAAIVFDDNEQLVVARSALPPDARAGDVVIVSAPPMAGTSAQALSAAPTIEVDAADTAASQARIRGLLDDIFKK